MVLKTVPGLRVRIAMGRIGVALDEVSAFYFDFFPRRAPGSKPLMIDGILDPMVGRLNELDEQMMRARKLPERQALAALKVIEQHAEELRLRARRLRAMWPEPEAREIHRIGF